MSLWVALAGMIVYLDTSALAQFMICQPIIACPLWGWIVGRPEIGLFFGVAFQLLYSGTLPVGAAKFPEGNLGALIATALAASVPAQANGNPAWIVIAIAAAVGVITAHFGAEVTLWLRKKLSGPSEKLVKAAQADDALQFSFIFCRIIGFHALVGFIFAFAAYFVGEKLLTLCAVSLTGVSSALAAETDGILSGIWPALLGIGAAVFARRFFQRATWPWFGLTTIAGIVAGWLWI
jgi:mannose/fructose/N-acetylgalactosamine-specific phosphotransferase system component IIC